jgi:hypothetical protein
MRGMSRRILRQGAPEVLTRGLDVGDGDWSPIALGFVPPQTQLLGLNKIIEFVYERQVALLLLFGGIACGWAGIGLIEIVSQSKRKG